MYLAPIVITGSGISESMMGLIIGSSSIAGMLFDFFLCRAIKETHYRSMFLFMLMLAALYPLFLFGGTTLTIYLVAMAVWGFYYDFYNIGTLDFVERTSHKEEQVSNFGILRSFEGTGYLIAPFIGSILLLMFHPGPMMLAAIAIPLVLSFFLYTVITLRSSSEKDIYESVKRKDVISFLKEMVLWKHIGILIFPLLILTLTINLVDSAIWTFGPIFSESLGKVNGFSGGFFMTAYALPPLLVGWFVGIATRSYSMKRTAEIAIGIGSILFIILGVISSFKLIIVIAFLASFFMAISWPTVNAVYTDHIQKVSSESKEIETLQDLFTNIGDTSGPIVGGYMAEYLGAAHTFIALGCIGGFISLVLLFKTKK